VISLGVKQRGGKQRRSPSKLELFLRLCQDIGTFMKEHGGNLRAFLSDKRGGKFGLYVVTEVEVYDFALGDKLAELAGPYVGRGLLESVTLLPACSPDELTAFFDPNSAMRIEVDHA
jgi:hypothetical protein